MAVASGNRAGSITETSGMAVAAVSYSVVKVTASGCAALDGTQRVASPVAETRRMVIAAVNYAIMEVTASRCAVFNRTQGTAGPIADSRSVVVPAVNHAVMAVPANDGTVLKGTNRNNILLALRGPAVVLAAAMTAMRKGRDSQHGGNKTKHKPSRKYPF